LAVDQIVDTRALVAVALDRYSVVLYRDGRTAGVENCRAVAAPLRLGLMPTTLSAKRTFKATTTCSFFRRAPAVFFSETFAAILADQRSVRTASLSAICKLLLRLAGVAVNLDIVVPNVLVVIVLK
jgi:hypothetical protein